LALPAGLTDEQINRLAEMIADGRCDFPQELSPADAQRLGLQVSGRLRNRLIHLIARAIADHLAGTSGSRRETSEHA
jgi:hypothetical protein